MTVNVTSHGAFSHWTMSGQCQLLPIFPDCISISSHTEIEPARELITRRRQPSASGGALDSLISQRRVGNEGQQRNTSARWADDQLTQCCYVLTHCRCDDPTHCFRDCKGMTIVFHLEGKSVRAGTTFMYQYLTLNAVLPLALYFLVCVRSSCLSAPKIITQNATQNHNIMFTSHQHRRNQDPDTPDPLDSASRQSWSNSRSQDHSMYFRGQRVSSWPSVKRLPKRSHLSTDSSPLKHKCNYKYKSTASYSSLPLESGGCLLWNSG